MADCTPNYTSFDVQHVQDDGFGGDEVTVFTVNGSLNDGSFAGEGPNGMFTLMWVATTWIVTDLVHGTAMQGADECNPAGEYSNMGMVVTVADGYEGPEALGAGASSSSSGSSGSSSSGSSSSGGGGGSSSSSSGTPGSGSGAPSSSSSSSGSPKSYG